MSVQTASPNRKPTTPDRRDVYPTRLAHAPDTPWLKRQEAVVKGSADDGPLSEDQLARFECRGFLFEPNFLDAEAVAELRRELKQLLDNDAYRGEDFSITEPDSREIRSLFAVHFLSPHFAALAADERLMGRARQILGGDAYVHQSRINYKPGFKGKGFDWHSDFETWHSEDGMPRMRSLSCSIILTDNGEFNGPLMLIPGSHRYFIPCVGRTPENNYKESLKSQEIGVPDAASLKALMLENDIEAPKGPSGSLVMFECNTLHGSNINMSCWPRSNLFFVYNSVENTLHDPYCGNKPRPEFLAARKDWSPLTPVDG